MQRNTPRSNLVRFTLEDPLLRSEFAALLTPGPIVGGADVLRSAEMPRDEIRRWKLFPPGCPGRRSEP